MKKGSQVVQEEMFPKPERHKLPFWVIHLKGKGGEFTVLGVVQASTATAALIAGAIQFKHKQEELEVKRST